jgi:uncharacterized glyoxalase superfamily metalloenzyme YdcJ
VAFSQGAARQKRDDAMTLQEVLQRIHSELTQAMGPLASALLEEKAAEFGMNLDTLPAEKVPVLVEEASFEIQNHRRKVQFQRAALEILRQLPPGGPATAGVASRETLEELLSASTVRRKPRLRLAEDPRARSHGQPASDARNPPARAREQE